MPERAPPQGLQAVQKVQGLRRLRARQRLDEALARLQAVQARHDEQARQRAAWLAQALAARRALDGGEALAASALQRALQSVAAARQAAEACDAPLRRLQIACERAREAVAEARHAWWQCDRRCQAMDDLVQRQARQQAQRQEHLLDDHRAEAVLAWRAGR